jgi:protein-disulfide isomerase
MPSRPRRAYRSSPTPVPRRLSLGVLTAVVGALGIGLVLLLAVLGGQLGLFGTGLPTASPPEPGASFVAAQHTAPPDLADGRSLGAANAPVQLELWSDFQCPSCRVFNDRIAPQLVDAYIRPGDARLNFRDSAFLGTESFTMAGAARCADAQGAFWPYHDLLYANQPPENSGWFTDQRAAEMAAFLGLDVGSLSACLADPATQSAVLRERNDGVEGGVTGTPTLFVNGVRVAALDWDAVSAAIEAALPTVAP